MISFKSAGHALATFFRAIVTVGAKVASDIKVDLTKFQGTEAVVLKESEAILGAIAPNAVLPVETVEKGIYAVAGEVISLINAGGAAAAAKLADAGLDKSVVSAAQVLASGASQVSTLIKAAVK